MYNFLTIVDGKYAIYDDKQKSFDFYTPSRLDKLLSQGDIGGIVAKTGFVKEVITDTPYTLARDLGDIAFVDYWELPTFLIRELVRIPKIPFVCNMYYKSLCITIRDSQVGLTHHINGPKGKILAIAPNYNENIITNYMNGAYIQNVDEYISLVKEFISCLSYDSAVLMYNISLDLDTPFLDLTKFEKSIKISRYSIQPVYLVHMATAKFQKIKYSGVYLKGYDYIDGKFDRTVNFIDCTEFRATDWNKAGVRQGLTDFLKLKMIPYGLVVFKRSAPLLDTIKSAVECGDNIKVINLGNFKNVDSIESTVQQIRIKQGKYALVNNIDNRKVVLMANIT